MKRAFNWTRNFFGWLFAAAGVALLLLGLAMMTAEEAAAFAKDEELERLQGGA